MFNLSGRQFVVLPVAEYRKLKAQAKAKPLAAAKPGQRLSSRRRTAQERQDRGDVAESHRALADPRRYPADEVFAKRRG
ncbi:MAG TPA: hypothetical protein VK324_12335 [Tepidisphaeraceae bacterium]|nr:hypothetical protein [Tepidisphaeraceae bacterium]